MTLQKKRKEIQRLISAFEKEADKYHNIKFSVIFVPSDGPIENRSFESPNHEIMLWQYYGKLGHAAADTKSLVGNLKNSDLKWGVRGAELSAFAVIEGETCDLFTRMAKRAGSLFNSKEALLIKSRVVGEIMDKEIGTESKPTAVINANEMAIWLNYLLYYISLVNPGREKTRRIEPDPFSLSLLALEQLFDDGQIGKVDKSLRKVEHIKFKVAVSFPGERRGYVSKVVSGLKETLGKDEVFYDFDYQSQLARPNMDTVLQNIYRHNSHLIVVFLCEEYSQKQWCGLEWRAIRDIIKSRKDDKVMLVRFDDADIDGVFSIDGYIDARSISEEGISELILERVALSEPESQDA